MCPAARNTRSDGTDVAGMQSTDLASLGNTGNRSLLADHHFRGWVEDGAAPSEKKDVASLSTLIDSNASSSVAVRNNKLMPSSDGGALSQQVPGQEKEKGSTLAEPLSLASPDCLLAKTSRILSEGLGQWQCTEPNAHPQVRAETSLSSLWR